MCAYVSALFRSKYHLNPNVRHEPAELIYVIRLARNGLQISELNHPK